MKYIKLFVLTIVIIGAIVGLKAIIDNINGPEVVVDSIAEAHYQKLSNEFKKEWEQITTWDKKLFESQHKEAEDEYGLNKIEESQRDNLSKLIHSYALDAVSENLVNLYKSTKYNESAVKLNLNGLTVISKHPDYSKNEKINMMKNIHETYRNILSFITIIKNSSSSRYTSQMEFVATSEDSVSWNSFSSLKSSDVSRRDSYRGNKYYQEYLMNNVELKDGLNAIPSYIEKHRSSYYKAVEEHIRNRFRNKPHITGNYAQLANNLRQEYSDSTITYEQYQNKLSLLKKELEEEYTSVVKEHNSEKRILRKCIDLYKEQTNNNPFVSFQSQYNNSISKPSI